MTIEVGDVLLHTASGHIGIYEGLDKRKRPVIRWIRKTDHYHHSHAPYRNMEELELSWEKI